MGHFSKFSAPSAPKSGSLSDFSHPLFVGHPPSNWSLIPTYSLSYISQHILPLPNRCRRDRFLNSNFWCKKHPNLDFTSRSTYDHCWDHKVQLLKLGEKRYQMFYFEGSWIIWLNTSIICLLGIQLSPHLYKKMLKIAIYTSLQ